MREYGFIMLIDCIALFIVQRHRLYRHSIQTLICAVLAVIILFIFLITLFIIQSQEQFAIIMMRCSSKCLLLAFLINVFLPTVQSSDSALQTSNKPSQYQPFTVRTSQAFQGQRRCGFRDRNIYMNNATFQQIGFYSQEKFTLFAQTDQKNISITAFAIATLTNSQTLNQLKHKQRKLYHIQRYKLYLVEEETTSDAIATTNQQINDKELSNKNYYYASLKVYGICRTASVSTISKNLQVKVTYRENIHISPSQSFLNNISSLASSDPNSSTFSLNTQTVTIPTVVYCIDGVSISQANFFVCKIYYLFIVAILALLLNFKPLKKVPLMVRISSLITFTWISLQASTLFDALFATYGAMFLLVVFYRIFQQRASVHPQTIRKQTIISKTYILVSFASALPLAIKSHLDDESVQQKKITLYLINFIMMCNSLLFISSMINLTRFRHAFYYFLALLLAEHYFYARVQGALAFGILEFQIFPAPYHCQSLFFAFWLIPLCDFFFKSYSSQSLYKFVILLVPILAKPFNITFSASFALGLLVWIINGRLNGRDIIKIIKYKK